MSIKETNLLHYLLIYPVDSVSTFKATAYSVTRRDPCKKVLCPLISFMEGMFSWLVLIYMQGLAFFLVLFCI